MTDAQPVITVRAAVAADIDALEHIGVESFTATYGDTTPPRDMAAHLDANFTADALRYAMENTSCHFLLASVDAKPAGFVKLRDENRPVEIPASNVLEIQLLYILPTFQRMGLGDRLVTAAADLGKETAVQGLWLSAWEHADWAINFYRKVGFCEVGTQEFRIGQTVFTDLLLWLPSD